MNDPLTFAKLGLATFALGMMMSNPEIQGPAGVFAWVRWLLGQIATRPAVDDNGEPILNDAGQQGRQIRRGGYWILSGLTCIVCWSFWAAVAFRGLGSQAAGWAWLVVDVFALSGFVIALERATSRPAAQVTQAPQQLTPGQAVLQTAGGGNCASCNTSGPDPAPTVLGLDKKITHNAPRKAANA